MVTIAPVALVRNTIEDLDFDQWKDIVSEIKLVLPFDPHFLQYLEGVEFIQVIFYFHKSYKFQLKPDNKNVFSHRSFPRPNNLGVSVVPLKRISDDVLVVEGLDAVNGTPVFDIKPFIKEELPADYN